MNPLNYFKMFWYQKHIPNDAELFSLNGYNTYCRVIKCYDGDTIHVIFKFNKTYKKFKVRLYGIDCSEIKSQSECSKNAKEYIENMILNKIVRLECLKYDKYGRILGKIYTLPNNIFINTELINRGFAIQYYGYGKKFDD